MTKEEDLKKVIYDTELKRKEIEASYDSLTALLRQAETTKTELENIMNCMNNVVMLVDGEDRIKRHNSALMKLIGEGHPSVSGRDWKSLLTGHGLLFDDDSLNRVRKDAEALSESAGGWYEIEICPYSASDMPEGKVITMHDTTELKILTESVEITNSIIEKDRMELNIALDEISRIMREVKCCKDMSLRFITAEFAGSDILCGIGILFNEMMDMLDAKHGQLEKAHKDLKSAHVQMLQQQKMASIGQLAAGVAHEINNPMGFIISNFSTLGKYMERFREFMQEQSSVINSMGTHESIAAVGEMRKKLKIDHISEDLWQLLKESLEGAERVKCIVQNLKSFSHLDEAEYKMADIDSGIESTISIAWNELKYKATLRKELGGLPMTKCNPGQINQVIMNMLVNAAHAIETHGEIAIKTWENGGCIYVSISDTGCGIPEDKINRIFEPFFTTKEVGKGTGLGLSIAYDIIKKHNGDISVESRVGEGTTFTIKIPVIKG